MSYPCPKCQDINTRSLPMIFQTADMSGPISITCAPPRRKGIKWWIIGILMMTPVPFVIAEMVQMPGAKGALINFLITMLIWTAIMAWGLLSAIRYNKTQWPELIERWRAAFLCRACGTMFHPE